MGRRLRKMSSFLFFSREVRLGSFSHFCILGSSRQLQQPNPNRPDPLGRVVKKKRVCYVDKSLGNCKKNRKNAGLILSYKKIIAFSQKFIEKLFAWISLDHPLCSEKGFKRPLPLSRDSKRKTKRRIEIKW